MTKAKLALLFVWRACLVSAYVMLTTLCAIKAVALLMAPTTVGTILGAMGMSFAAAYFGHVVIDMWSALGTIAVDICTAVFGDKNK